MIIVSEADAKELISVPESIEVIAEAFSAVDGQKVESYPVVREKVAEAEGIFGVKSGVRNDTNLLGLKAGGYWKKNQDAGVGNHQSSTVLFCKMSGVPLAFVSANYLTALRTAAAAGLATRALAREDAQTLAIIGAGGQAPFQIEAIRAVRPIERVLIVSRSQTSAEELAARLNSVGAVKAIACDAEAACKDADILTTVTPSSEQLVQAGWIRPGTHINAMGADTRGKRELDPKLLLSSRVFVDDWRQASTIGECQHLAHSGELSLEGIAGTLGGLASGRDVGRLAATDVTVFDSTGLAIQDLAVAAYVVEKAKKVGIGSEVELGSAAA